MLRWRLLVGTALILAVIALGWLDHRLELRHADWPPGACLFPVGLICLVLATGEALSLVRRSGLRPPGWAIYAGNVLLFVSPWVAAWNVSHATGPQSDAAGAAWALFALAVGLGLVLAGQMWRYQGPGGVVAGTGAGVLVLVYLGVPFCFLGLLRMGSGLGALASLVIVVKAGDTGAYTVGRLMGRRKMAPALSPGKTIEGAAGGLAFACLASWLTFQFLIPPLRSAPGVSCPWWGWPLFGLLVAGGGMIGDLAASLLKRDAGCKESSRWLPGLGGVLDVFDSILLGAPLAWLCWSLGVVR